MKKCGDYINCNQRLHDLTLCVMNWRLYVMISRYAPWIALCSALWIICYKLCIWFCRRGVSRSALASIFEGGGTVCRDGRSFVFAFSPSCQWQQPPPGVGLFGRFVNLPYRCVRIITLLKLTPCSNIRLFDFGLTYFIGMSLSFAHQWQLHAVFWRITYTKGDYIHITPFVM